MIHKDWLMTEEPTLSLSTEHKDAVDLSSKNQKDVLQTSQTTT